MNLNNLFIPVFGVLSLPCQHAGVTLQPPVPLSPLLRAQHPGRRRQQGLAPQLHGLQRKNIQGQKQPAKT